MKKSLICILLAGLICLGACIPAGNKNNEGKNTACPTVSATEPAAAPTETAPAATEDAGASVPVFPEHWEYDIKNEYKEMVIDADIVTPADMDLSVRRVTKHNVTAEDAARVGAVFFPEITGWLVGGHTREQIEAAIDRVQQADIPEETRRIQLEALYGTLETTEISEEELVNAGSFSQIDRLGEGFGLGGISVKLPDGSFGRFVLRDNAAVFLKHRAGVLQTEEGMNRSGGGYEGEENWEVTPDISPDEAEDRAQSYLSAIGLEGFALTTSEEARIGDIYSMEIYEMGWLLSFTRSFGYPAIDMETFVSQYPFAFESEDSEYTAMWKNETVKLFVSGSGVGYMSWENPLDDEGETGEAAELMGFDQLSERIINTFSVGISSPKQSEGYFKLETMTLTALPLQRKGESESAYYTPVWVLRIGCYTSLSGMGLSHFFEPGEQLFECWDIIVFTANEGTVMKRTRVK